MATDPQWTATEIAQAWLPYEGEFGFLEAQHLLRRAAFGGSVDKLQRLTSVGSQQAVETILAPQDAATFDEEANSIIQTRLVLGESQQVIDWWLYRMRFDPFAVREKATWMWHGHFCTSRTKVTDARLLWQQNDTLRRHALGSFADLVKQISRDPAMLIYLDSTTNRKNHPNENYARELMELFCLGLGEYSEQDIRELARCFTGWEVRRQRFRFSPTDHDKGEKQFLGAKGHFDGDSAIDVVLAQPAAQRFIARKLIHFYITDDPVPTDVVDSLADLLATHDWQLQPVLATLFNSRLFYSTRCRGRQVLSPVNWTLNWLNALAVGDQSNRLRSALEWMGCVPLEPPNVKGWPGGNNWIDPTRMLARADWALQLSRSGLEPPGGLAAWLSQQNITNNEQACQWVLTNLVGRTVAPARQITFRHTVSQANEPIEAFRIAVRAASLLPETHVA